MPATVSAEWRAHEGQKRSDRRCELAVAARRCDGNERALPGSVVVRLNPNWSNAQVQSWLADQGVKVVDRLPIGNNVLVLFSPPGLPALANKL